MYRKIAIILCIIGVAVAAYIFVVDALHDVTPVDVEEVTYTEIQDSMSEVNDAIVDVQDPSQEMVDEVVVEQEENSVNDSTLPRQFNLAVPFTSQAPHANWELPYQEACEEASILMVQAYYEGQVSGQINPDIADAEIQDLVAFQQQLFGNYLDTTAKETVELIDAYYGYTAYVVENPSVEQVKEQIAQGYPVIIPTAGRLLGNPNFSGEGPVYHMLVIKGYTETSFITHDPGTRNGASYVYDIDVIMNALGDWNNGNPEEGKKVMIFTQP